MPKPPSTSANPAITPPKNALKKLEAIAPLWVLKGDRVKRWEEGESGAIEFYIREGD
ncbi:hypothetical protein HC928_20310 [bacterium]|nr:hypothetical protein [bacterium]